MDEDFLNLNYLLKNSFYFVLLPFMGHYGLKQWRISRISRLNWGQPIQMSHFQGPVSVSAYYAALWRGCDIFDLFITCTNQISLFLFGRMAFGWLRSSFNCRSWSDVDLSRLILLNSVPPWPFITIQTDCSDCTGFLEIRKEQVGTGSDGMMSVHPQEST